MGNIKQSKVLVIGLDGATFNLMRPWMDQGLLPNLGRVCNQGASGNLRSTLPPTTAAAWSSLMTGRNPGSHGIFGMTTRMDNQYRIMPLNSTFRHGRDLWEILSDHGLKVGVVNVPMTHPVRKIDGIMVTGLMTPPDAEDYTYPRELAGELDKAIGEYRVQERVYRFVEGNEESFLKELYDTTKMRADATLYLMENHEWDFFMVVFEGTDKIQHAMWHHTDPNHPRYAKSKAEKYSGAILRYYQHMDGVVGKLLSKIDENTVVFLVSDHGAGPLYKWIHVNNILMKHGFLTMKRNLRVFLKLLLFKMGFAPLNLYRLLLKLRVGKVRGKIGKEKARRMMRRFLLSFHDVDWDRTRAYSMGGYCQIIVNLKGREPKGIVDPHDEYHQVTDGIAKLLSDLKDPQTGMSIFDPGRIYRKEDVYRGPLTGKAPDLIFLPKETYLSFPGFEFGTNETISGVSGWSGAHRMNGILAINGMGVSKGAQIEDAKIEDVAPTILYLLGVPIPRDMDGRVLTEAFEPKLREARPVQYAQETAAEWAAGAQKEYSVEEQEKLKRVLRGLGYL